MTLAQWHQRLHAHFKDLRQSRTDRVGDKPIFVLEHGLDTHELAELDVEIRAHILSAPPSIDHSLPWLVYAAEIGYGYAGDEYWLTFEKDTPGWVIQGERPWLRERFRWFHDQFGGARPSGAWADHFSIICWPITHAILPRDLQRQLARVLYQLRDTFTADLLASPAALGERIAARSFEGTSRFQNFAQETLLLGQIAAALLLEGESGTAGLLLPATLKRIGNDLDRERSGRDWLRGARYLAQQRARFNGLSASGPLRAAPSEHPRKEVASLGIEPRLVLRPTEMGGAHWDAFLEIPDFSHLLLKFPGAREALVESRCTVAGASGRPLARSGLLHGATQVALSRWPQQAEVLLQFEKASPQLEYLLRTEFLLRPGPTWLFRIASDGLAYELRSLRVRPGQQYVIVSTAGPIPTSNVCRAVTLSCEGAYGGLLELPPALAPAEEAFLQELRLSQATTIHVWPAGLAAAAWDGEGRGEWLANEKPCVAIRPDHALASVVVALQQFEANPLDLGPVLPGEAVFVELPPFPVGVHQVRVHARRTLVESRELLGELDVVIRERRPWMPGLSKQGPLIAQLDPPFPTLDQLWEGQVNLELLGPRGRSVTCTASLFERGSEGPSITRKLPSLALPLTPAVWRGQFNKHFSAATDVQNAYDVARACELEFRADELGAYTLRCERSFTPLRWAVRREGHSHEIMLLDDSGAATAVEASLYLFETPDTPQRLDAVPLGRSLLVPAHGGMYMARQGSFIASLIVPPVIHTLTDLRCDPRFGNRSRSPERARQLLDLIELWASARLTGNIFSASRQRDVLRALTRHLFFTLGGEVWERAELSTRSPGGGDHTHDVSLRRLRLAVSTRPDESMLGSALANESLMLASAPIQKRIRHFSSQSQRFLHLSLPAGTLIPGKDGVRLVKRDIEDNPQHPDWLCEFALRLASDPAGVATWARGNVGAGLKRLFDLPTLARAARYLVLSVEQHLQGLAGMRATVYAGWEWE
jgi:hypothetical protein